MQIQPTHKFPCPAHADQLVMFICAVNDWHFEPLCQLCTPNHTQSHGKRLKINLQSFQELNKKVHERSVVVENSYKQELNKVKTTLSDLNIQNFTIIKDLKQLEQKVLQKVKTYFAIAKENVSNKIKVLLTQNQQKLRSLASNLQNEISFIRKISNPEIKFDQWKASSKKIYFTEKQQSYLEQSAQILGQFKQKVKTFEIEKKKRPMKQEQKFWNSLTGLISAQVKFILGEGFVQTNQKKPSNFAKDEKKTVNGKQMPKPNPKIMIKKKLCKNCNEQMQYLTQNKKHLICRYCNSKQRNYVKKPL